jgi:hypothetical protein
MSKLHQEETSKHAEGPAVAPVVPEGASAKLRALAGGGYDAATEALKPPAEKQPVVGASGGGLKVDKAAAKAMAREVIGRGVSGEAAVTDEVFYGLFPQLAGQKLSAKSP